MAPTARAGFSQNAAPPRPSPSISSRKPAIPHDAGRHGLRAVIERAFRRHTDVRRLATRCGKADRTLLPACLVPAGSRRAWFSPEPRLQRQTSRPSAGFRQAAGDLAWIAR